jgi:hypothetical protein
MGNNYYGNEYDFYQQSYPQTMNYQQVYPQMYRQHQFITRMVSNIDEAKCSLVDGLSTHIFVDYNSGKIYLKKLNNSGLSDFLVYSLDQNPKAVENPLVLINERLTAIEKILGEKNVLESNSNDTTTDFTENASRKSKLNESCDGNDTRKK